MPFEFNRYSGLLLIFFVHGFVYSILLLKRGFKYGHSSDKWLSFFLFLCILYICPWMLGFAGWYDGTLCLECRNFMFYMPLQHTLLMGPAIFFYTSSLLQPKFRFTRKHLIHFIPGILYLIWNLVVFITDRVILKDYYLMDGINDPDFQGWYLAAGLISILFYGLLSYRFYIRYKKFIVQQFSFADTLNFRWIQNFLISLLIYFVSHLLIFILDLAGIGINYSQTWWYYLLFALLFYYISINGYSHAIETRTRFQFDISQTILLLNNESKPETTELINYDEEEKEIETIQLIPELESWKNKIKFAVVDEQLYQNPELTLTDLAKHLNTNSVLLSKYINRGFGMNFNDFINSFRVDEVRKKLESGAGNQFTIMSLAYEAGFNSKATFNRAFKKFTGKAPKDFTNIT